ncbi:MAG: carbonic anhydrase [Candidatus Thorarchaeota archaeon]
MISNIENLLIEGNMRYQWNILQGLDIIETNDKIPKYPVLILTCIDPRIDVYRIFQLNSGDVFVLRNAGNLITNDTMRAILLTVYKYKIKYIIILGHLDCGMTKINLLELKQKIPHEFLSYKSIQHSDLFSEVREFFKPFENELKNIKHQVESLQRLNKYNPEVKITGMLYDVETGWVFEYDKFEKFINIDNFRPFYEALLRDKKSQFVNFIKTIENEIIRNDKPDEKMLERELTEVKRSESTQLIDKEEDFPGVNFQNLKIELDEEFTTPIVMPKIKIPKIHFPGIKIYIPKKSRKKN